MSDKQELAPPARSWTRIDSYLWGVRRRRSAARRRRSARPARDPDPPRPVLSTLPFMVLILGLVVITVAIVMLARPGALREHNPPPPQPQVAEPGTAPPGWLENG
ncbi:MAG TPA: hypothetical protein VM265_00685 [Sphingomicrobium sp.]|nr:hypothetical protein [Sphingomicrobium sp.]